ncbi:MAG: hypothetical protein AAF614_08095 [Chloroflexota bacterium]
MRDFGLVVGCWEERPFVVGNWKGNGRLPSPYRGCLLLEGSWGGTLVATLLKKSRQGAKSLRKRVVCVLAALREGFWVEWLVVGENGRLLVWGEQVGLLLEGSGVENGRQSS